jgi:ribosomal protein S18 acetylase RimI-like enzyme
MTEIRPGDARDVPALVELMFVEPSREMLVLGGGRRAPQLAEALMRHEVEHGSASLLVATGEHGVVGFAQVSGDGEIPPLSVLARMAVRTLGLPAAVVAGWRSLARMKVDLAAPAGGLHLAELQVHPHRRGAGIGGLLIAAVEAEAARRGLPHVSLTTTTSNPARRLYARSGYEVVREVTDRRYERLTGSAGRILMVKPLSP